MRFIDASRDDFKKQNAHRYENRNDESQKRWGIQKRTRRGHRRYLEAQGIYIGRPTGVFVLSGRQYLQSILDLRDFVPARCRAGSISAHGGRSNGLGRAFGIGMYGQQRVFAGFCTIWISLFVSFRLFSSLFFSSSLYPHLHSSHFLETQHVQRFTPLFEVDQRAPLVGRPGPA